MHPNILAIRRPNSGAVLSRYTPLLPFDLPVPEKDPDIVYRLGESIAVSEASQFTNRQLFAMLATLFSAARSPIDEAWLPTVYHSGSSAGFALENAATFSEGAFDAQTSKLLQILSEEPVEPGITHPAEAYIRDGLARWGRRFTQWIVRNVTVAKPAEAAIGLFLCVGRMTQPTLGPRAYELAQKALSSRSIEIRDAAVRALEYWGGSQAARILETHKEKVSWLADYIQRVVREIKRHR